MLILAIDTSSPIGSVALWDQNGLIGLLTVSVQLTHSEGLMPAIDALFERTGTSSEQLTAVACTNGPGSYTGMRVGIATAQGFAYANQIQCVAVSSLDVLAWIFPHSSQIVCPVLSARKGWIYTRLYRWNENDFTHLSSELYVQPEELVKEIHEPVLLFGPGLDPYRDLLKEALDNLFLELPGSFDIPRADLLAELAARKIAQGDTIPPEQLLPHYLGPSQAEINWKKRQNHSKTPS